MLHVVQQQFGFIAFDLQCNSEQGMGSCFPKGFHSSILEYKVSMVMLLAVAAAFAHCT